MLRELVRDFRQDLYRGEFHAWFAVTAMAIACVWIAILTVQTITRSGQ